MPRCLKYSREWDNYDDPLNPVHYVLYVDDNLDVDTCGNTGDMEKVVLNGAEYVRLGTEGFSQDFDTTAYDLVYEGVLSSWALGLGIGFILAMVARLKR